ncbi:MAG: xanthine dehydrogenase family protein subunit M [Chloroflexi bacterium]|nr:xanthine dehydrogenase family protein subunit M [Chloroflexota bacterium]
MIPPRFEYHAATSVMEAVGVLGQHKDAKILAGGHSILPAMKLRLAQPATLVDIGRIKELSRIIADANGTTIGAMTTHAMIAASNDIRQRLPALSKAAELIGDQQVRNRGTIGGSIAHADPAADYPAVLLALGAEMHAIQITGSRTIRASDFFVDLMTTALKSNELLVDVRIPALAPRSGSAYVKFPQPASRFALVGVCACVTLDDKGVCAKASIGITGACASARRATATESALLGKKLDAAIIQAAAAQAASGMDCLSDIHASAEYRAHLVTVMTARAIQAAVARVM